MKPSHPRPVLQCHIPPFTYAHGQETRTNKSEFVFFDVVYEDGSQRSNRRVPADLLGGLEKDEPRARLHPSSRTARSHRRSGQAPLTVKTVTRVGAKPKKEMARVSAGRTLPASARRGALCNNASRSMRPPPVTVAAPSFKTPRYALCSSQDEAVERRAVGLRSRSRLPAYCRACALYCRPEEA